jgi:hypothetical protein
MVMFAMNALVNSLSHVIGYEATTGKTPKRGWAQDATDEDKDAWRIRGHEEMQGWAERFMTTYATKLGQLWRKVSPRAKWRANADARSALAC